MRANAPAGDASGEASSPGGMSENETAPGGVSGMDAAPDSAGRTPPTAPPSLSQSIERLDTLLASAADEEKIRAGMGIRLALGMAQELKDGLPLGTETADLVAGWAESYGRDTVDAAIAIAREFLTKPDEMRKVLGQKLGLGNPG